MAYLRDLLMHYGVLPPADRQLMLFQRWLGDTLAKVDWPEHRQIPSLRGRTAAIRQLVLQAPAPVVATMLGYNPEHTAWLLAEAGATWTRYAAGDHTPQ